MKKRTSFILIVALLVASIFPLFYSGRNVAFALGQITPTALTTDYAVNPLGIDNPSPRMSWKLSSSLRAQTQSAYQILVSSSAANLAANNGDKWNSGKVASNQSNNITYAGSALQSGKRYYWKVTVWDQSDMVSSWSAAAWFEMGMLNAGDWQGSWIGWDRGTTSGFSLAGVPWIWYPEGNPAVSAPAGTRYFRKTFSLPASPQIKQVVFGGMADDSFVLFVNGKEIVRGSAWDKPVFVDLTGYVQAGSNTITIAATNANAGPAGLLGNLRITYADSSTAAQQTNNTWKAANTLQSGWEQPGFNDASWAAAMQISSYGGAPWGNVVLPSLKIPAPLFRNTFTLAKTVSSARAYISSAGYYELRLNGAKVGNNVLDPGFTAYNKRTLYTTYDVTSMLQQGANAIGVELGRGFFGLKTPNIWNWEQVSWNGEPKFKMQLNIAFTDGTTSTVVSDGTWNVAPGPTTSDSIYAGESYDARRERTGWDTAGFAAAGWSSANVMSAPANTMKAQVVPPIQVVESINPVSTTNPKTNTYVFDLGTVTAGWARLTVSGSAGTRVTLIYGEKLNADGTVDNDNGLVYEAVQTDTYDLKGGGTEVWEPKFSYKGFRYVEVIGLPAAPGIIGRVVRTAVDSIGSFSSSNPAFNLIHDATRRSILNNLHSIPTDTPNYEKNGWTGDASLIAETAIFNFDMPLFYEKWTNDMKDSQNASGLVPMVVPSSGWGYDHAPEWSSAYILIPWHLYRFYGDKKVLTEHYATMRTYMENEISLMTGYISSSVLGDWLAPGYVSGNPPEGSRLTATAYVFRDAGIMAQIAQILGNTADYNRYTSISGSISAAFNGQFFDAATNTYRTEATSAGYRQTSNVLSLAYNLVSAGTRPSVVSKLANHIAIAKTGHLDTGILGTKELLPVLTEFGYGELAYTVANQHTYPSWGHWLENGGNTLWEAWELSARSRNHAMFGTIDEWFFNYLAGINSASPGFKTIRIKPYILGDLTNVSAQIDTISGSVSSSWVKNANNELTLSVAIPVNTTATVYVPTTNGAVVTEGGVPAATAPGVQFLQMVGKYAVYAVGSGNYAFVSKYDGNGNLAIGAAMTASSSVETADWGLGKADDGMRGAVGGSMGWTSNNSLSVNHTESITLDMGTSKTIGKVDLYPRNDGANTGYGFPIDYTIQVSVDNTNWTTVVTRTGNPLPGDSVQSYIFTPQTARYVKIQGTNLRSNPNDANSYRMQFAEIELFNNSANLAAGTAVTATSSVETADWARGKAIDGNQGSLPGLMGWTSTNNLTVNHTESITLDMITNKSLSKVDLYPRNDGANTGYGFPIDFTVKVSTDATNWTTVVTRTGYALPAGNVQSFAFPAQTARYVKIEGTSLRSNPLDANAYRMQFAEIELSNSANLAIGAVISSTSSVENTDWGRSKLTDGMNNAVSGSMGWTSDGNLGANHSESITMDLSSSKSVSRVNLYPRNDGANTGYGFPINFTIKVSTDGVNWTTAYTGTGYPKPGNAVQSFTFGSQTARFVKIEGTSLRSNPLDSNNYRMQFEEIEIYA